MQQIRRSAGDDFADEVMHQLARGLVIVDTSATWVKFEQPQFPSHRNRGRWWMRRPWARWARQGVTIVMLCPTEATEWLPLGSGGAVTEGDAQTRTPPFGATVSEPLQRNRHHHRVR